MRRAFAFTPIFQISSSRPARRPFAQASARAAHQWLPAIGLAALSCSATPPSGSGAGPSPVVPSAAASVTTGSAGCSGGCSSGAGVPSNVSGHNLIQNSTFDGRASVPWNGLVLPPAVAGTDVQSGEFCATITKPGEHPWDVQLRHRFLAIQKGHTYAIRYKVHASKPMRAHLKVGMAGPPYTEHWAADIALGPEPLVQGGTFTMSSDDDPTAEFGFHFGGALAGTAFPVVACIDDIVLDDPAFVSRRDRDEVAKAAIRVNQVGYFPRGPKTATLSSRATEPLAWELVDSRGAKTAAGKTAVWGLDTASGEPAHVIDFTEVKASGEGFKLVVGEEVSHPFAIGKDIYKKLKHDALAYFYQSRSGVAIEMPYAEDPKWARRPGHLSDVKTPCAPGSGCDYALDVSGGWYDAGDYGKYVVNAGISVWTLLNQWERAKGAGESAAVFGDGALNIPERKNGVPDLLDEVRWEIEWMLKMQVPAGQPRAGMAHHKMHDEEWTALGHEPADDPMRRFLQPPSTAATLNLAAVAAQGARIYRPWDAKFAARCLDAAERAWAAAEKNPAEFAPSGPAIGGGPYGDSDVSDEFYWAAAELYVTTGKPAYEAFVLKSPHHREPVLPTEGDATSFTWQRTQALGTLSLAIVPSRLAPNERRDLQRRVIQAADGYLAIQKKEAYGQAVPGTKPYRWGSNSFILNNLIVLAVAGDFTHDAKYTHGVAAGFDYLLGRNPLDQSYVSGYGARPLRHPHHRFWAPEANPKLPPAPPGIVAGGPNSSLQDGYVRGAGLQGCAPAQCYVDNMEAPSVNEVAINWNAPLAWVVAWLDGKAKQAP